MTLVGYNLTFIHSLHAAPNDGANSQRKSLIQLEQQKDKAVVPQFADEDTPKFFFSYEESFTLRMSSAIDFKELEKKDGNKDLSLVFGMKYMLKSSNSKHQEYGIDLVTGRSSRLYLNGGYKFIIDHSEALRPYYKVGAAIRFDEGDHLETPFDLKSWSLVMSAGLEDLIKDPSSLRVDLDIFMGKEDFLALVSLGWSMGL